MDPEDNSLVDQEIASNLANNNWQRKVNTYVDECLLSASPDGKCQRSLRHQERPYRSTDEIKRVICKRIRRGIYTDAVSFDRIRSTKECEGENNTNADNLFTGTNLGDLGKHGIAEEKAIFSQDLVQNLSMDEETQDLDLEVATMEYYESVLLSTRKHALGLLDKKEQIIKYFEYVNHCNVNGVIISLLNVMSLIDYSAETVLGFEMSNGIAILLNLLSSDVVRVQKASLKVLIKLCQLLFFGRIVVGLGGLPTLANLMSTGVEGVDYQVAELLSELAYLKETRTIAFRTRLIIELVCLLGKLVPDMERLTALMKVQLRDEDAGSERLQGLTIQYMEVTSAISNVMKTLAKLATNTKNIQLIREAGTIPLMMELVGSTEVSILVPTFLLLSMCAKQEINRKTIITGNYLPIILNRCDHPDLMVRVNSAAVVGACLVEPTVRMELLKRNGFVGLFSAVRSEADAIRGILSGSWLVEEQLDFKVCNLSQRNVFGKNDLVMKTSSSAVRSREASCATRIDDPTGKHFYLLRSLLEALGAFVEEKQYAGRLVSLGFTQVLVYLISVLSPYILTHLQSACCVSPKIIKLQKLEQCTACVLQCIVKLNQVPAAQKVLSEAPDLVKNIVNLLSLWKSPVLEPCIDTVTTLASHQFILNKLLNEHAFRIIFSLSMHESLNIRAAALRAATILLHAAPNKTEMLRPVAGSLHKFINMIREVNESIAKADSKAKRMRIERVLQWSFAFVAEMGHNPLYRTIIEDLGIAKLLISHLCLASTTDARISLVSALQYTSGGLIKCANTLTEKDLLTLFSFLKPPNEVLQMTTGHVIYALDKHPSTSRRMQELKINKLLLQMLGSGIRELQLAAATTICKMRLKFKKKSSPMEEYAVQESVVKKEMENV